MAHLCHDQSTNISLDMVLDESNYSAVQPTEQGGCCKDFEYAEDGIPNTGAVHQSLEQGHETGIVANCFFQCRCVQRPT